MKMEELFLTTSDSVEIAINHYNGGKGEVLIIAPGWFMTKDCCAFSEMAEIFSAHFDVITMDFRGHGKSKGYYTFSAKEAIDIQTVINFAKAKYKKVYLMGFSLGAAIATVHSAVYKDIDKLILVSAPHSFEKIENHWWTPAAWIPTFKKFELTRWLSIRPSLVIHPKIKPIGAISQIICPTLFMAGENDPTVFPWHTEALFKAAACKKHYELFNGCNHAEDLFLEAHDKFVALSLKWLET